MVTNTSAWTYTDAVPDARRRTLAEPGSFQELLRRVVDDAQNVRVSARPGSDRGLTDCFRPVFVLDLPRSGDALFNGPYGYRAQYLVSPQQGLAANTELLAALAPKLLGSVDASSAPDLSKIDVCAALHAASAKFWIRELPSELLEPPEDLAVESWAKEARKGVELARWGLMAPSRTQFEVKGAFLDPYGNEVVPAVKIRRHYLIHHYGYS